MRTPWRVAGAVLAIATALLAQSTFPNTVIAPGFQSKPTVTFEQLKPDPNGTIRYCTNCNQATPVGGGGTGGWIARNNGVWQPWGTGGSGSSGPTGPAGASGPSGPSGAGATGPSGPTGTTGATGPGVGATGPTGATGASGPSGPSGAAGTNGTNGSNGAAGASGASGPTGATGATGASGASGPSGASGATGTAGTSVNWQGTYSAGTTYALDDGVSDGTASYVSLSNGNIGHTPASSPTFWQLIAQQGAQGASGPSGASGAAGASGASGPSGPSGANGTSGTGASVTNIFTGSETNNEISFAHNLNTLTPSFGGCTVSGTGVQVGYRANGVNATFIKATTPGTYICTFSNGSISGLGNACRVTTPFTAQTIVIVSNPCGTASVSTTIYDSTGTDNALMHPDNVHVDKSTFNVTITFTVPQTGFIVNQ